MDKQSVHHDPKSVSPVSPANIPESLEQEYASRQALFDAQPPEVQQFLEVKAEVLANALIECSSHVSFELPEHVILEVGSAVSQALPKEAREKNAVGFIGRISKADIRTQVRQRLLELEGDESKGVAVAARLLRYVTTAHLIYRVLPSGRTVTYLTIEDEDIPTQPTDDEQLPSAITSEADAIAEEGDDAISGELVVPYVPYARGFYLPQWVAFDEGGQLLARSIQEAEGSIASMQHFLEILHIAVALAAYMIADPEYQRKRYGMLGQLINQGRHLAKFQTDEIIQTIKRRASAQNLNRGLSLSLPYFDDQDLVIKLHDIQVIPAGRVMFVPSFVVRASMEEQAKVAQDTRLNPSTRKYLLKELDMLARAFLPEAGY